MSSTWTGVGLNGSTLTNTEIASAITNDPGPVGSKHRPPLLFISPDGADQACRSQSTDYGNKRLLRRREYLVASPLPYIPGEPNYIASTISFDAPSNSACNPSGISSTTNKTTNMTDWLSSSNSLFAMYYNSSSYMNTYGTDSISSLSGKYFIGSAATSACVSRFGIQDPIGYGTIFSDMFTRANGTTVPPTATAISSDYDSGNADNGSFSFNGSQGTGFISGQTHGTWVIYYSYFHNGGTQSCSSNSAYTSYFIPPLGLPVCAWTSSTQTLRNMSEFQATSKLGTFTGGASGVESNRYPSVAINSSSSVTGYNMISGFVGRFSSGMTPTGSYVQTYNSVICGVEAE